MNPCETCPIDDKLYECCGRHPETGETAWLKLSDGRVVRACPHLSEDGRCLIYERRPYGCRRHQCARFAHEAARGEDGCALLAALWAGQTARPAENAGQGRAAASRETGKKG